MWEGPMMTALSRTVADDGYGAIVSVVPVQVGLIVGNYPWLSGGRTKEALLRINDAALLLVFARDRDSGTVTLDGAGRPRVDYWPSAHDRDSMMQGMELCLRAAIAAGASEVCTLQAGAEAVFFREEAAGAAAGFGETTLLLASASLPARLDAYVQRVKRVGIHKYHMAVLSAHQMCSARLGATPGASVCDPAGECWEVAGLYVCDASLLPTCSGSNPMVTTEALAWMLMGALAGRWRNGSEGGGGGNGVGKEEEEALAGGQVSSDGRRGGARRRRAGVQVEYEIDG